MDEMDEELKCNDMNGEPLEPGDCVIATFSKATVYDIIEPNHCGERYRAIYNDGWNNGEPSECFGKNAEKIEEEK